MSFATEIGQRGRNGWKRTAGAALTTVMLSAVVVLGLALLGSDVLASWKAPQNTEPALALSQGPLTFEAPASTLARLHANEDKIQNGTDLVDNAALLVNDWQETSLTYAQFQDLYRFLIIGEIILDTYLQGRIPSENLQTLMFLQFLFNMQFLQLAPPISPSS